MNNPVIAASGLTKKFNGFTAVKEIDFEIYPGECFGFLGPNGAGKTTTMQMIYCFTPITDGELTVMDLDPRKNSREIKRHIGVVPQEDNLDPDLTVYENLRVYARYFDIRRAEAHRRTMESLDLFHLTEKKDAKIAVLSGGMKRRLILARSLLNNPTLIILDEPTTGLDPQARHLIWQKLRALKQNGTTLVLTTHNMEEAENLCDRLAIMDEAEIIATGSPAGLMGQYVSSETVEISLSPSCDEQKLREILPLDKIDFQSTADTMILFPADADQLLNVLSAQCDIHFRRRSSTLEDVFLKLTGRELRD